MSKFTQAGRKILELSGLVASAIPFDLTGTGLSATNVQQAIAQTLSQMLGGAQVFAGRIAAAGTIIRMSSNASTWTAGLSTSTYTITHNLLLASANDLVVVPMALNATVRVSGQVIAYNTNNFQVQVFNAADSAITTAEWGFIAMRLVLP